jgi:hypothetical protein
VSLEPSLKNLQNTAANYTIVCGPPRYAEIRINISQAFNGVGTVVAPVLGSYVFFLKTGDDANAIKNVSLTGNCPHSAVSGLILDRIRFNGYTSPLRYLFFFSLACFTFPPSPKSLMRTWPFKPKRLTRTPMTSLSANNIDSFTQLSRNSVIRVLKWPLLATSSTM